MVEGIIMTDVDDPLEKENEVYSPPRGLKQRKNFNK